MSESVKVNVNATMNVTVIVYLGDWWGYRSDGMHEGDVT